MRRRAAIKSSCIGMQTGLSYIWSSVSALRRVVFDVFKDSDRIIYENLLNRGDS